MPKSTIRDWSGAIDAANNLFAIENDAIIIRPGLQTVVKRGGADSQSRHELAGASLHAFLAARFARPVGSAASARSITSPLRPTACLGM